MKTSKRFLSIVLMLAMLVSMFTVMAFADDDVQIADDERRITLAVGDNGKVMVENTEYTGTSTRVLKKNAVLKAVPNKGYVATWFFVNESGAEIEYGSGAQVGLNAFGSSIEKIVVKFTLKDDPKPNPDPAPTPEPTPDPVPEDSVKVTATIVNTANVQNALVLFDGEFVKNGDTVAVSKDKLTNGRAVFSTSADEEYTVSWKLDDADAVSGKSYTLTPSLTGVTHTLTVTFNKSGDGELEKRTLDVSVSGRGELTHGDIVIEKKASYDLAEDESIKFEAYAREDYHVEWSLDNGRTNYSNGRSETIKIKFNQLKESGSKLYVAFVRDSSDSHTHNWVKKFNDTYHWKECSRCGDKTDKEKHTYIYDYDQYGYRYDKCKYCDWTSDYSYNHSSSHKEYTYEDINATYHWKTCKKCDYSVKEYHTWIKNTDRKTKDSYPYVCKYCDRLSKTAYTDLPFYDVDGNVWYYDDVLYAYINGYMDGLSAVEFGANQNTTRAQIVTILWRLTGEPRATKSNKFSDVSSAAYYDKAVSWAVEAGVVNGFDAKTFKPNDYVTREQLAAILYRYAEYMNLSTRGASNLTKYDDYYQIGTWARDAMAWANYHGLINGVSYTRIDPKGLATRAQVAAILHRFAVEFGNY